MKIFIASLLFLAVTASAQTPGRGLIRHSRPGITECHEHIADVVELRAPSSTCPNCKEPAPVRQVPRVATTTTVVVKEKDQAVFLPPIFASADDVKPHLPDIGEESGRRAEVLETTSRNPAPRLYNPDTAVGDSRKGADKKKDEPTAEQLQMMRDLHLSVPPTILNEDNSVRATGRTSKGATLSAPSVPYIQPYCPECQRRRF